MAPLDRPVVAVEGDISRASPRRADPSPGSPSASISARRPSATASPRSTASSARRPAATCRQLAGNPVDKRSQHRPTPSAEVRYLRTFRCK